MGKPTDKVSAGKPILFRGSGYNVSCEYLLYTFDLEHGTFIKYAFEANVVSMVNQTPKSLLDCNHLFGLSLRNNLFGTQMQKGLFPPKLSNNEYCVTLEIWVGRLQE